MKRKRLPYSSIDMYERLEDDLKPTRVRLRVNAQQYLALGLSQKQNGLVPTTCTVCLVQGSMNINLFFSKHQLQACFCNGGIKWNTELGKQRLGDLVSKSRFVWENAPDLHVANANSMIRLICSACGERTSPSVAQFVNGLVGCSRTSTCRIPRPKEWKHTAGKSRLDNLVSLSKFDWNCWNTRHDKIDGEDSRIDLICPICFVVSSAT